MKLRKLLYLSLGLLLVTLVGCSGGKQENISLEIWHYYNGAQKITFDDFVDEFNETIGLEKGIIVEAYSQGSIGQLEEKVMNSVANRVGASHLPDMVTVYSETSYNLDQKGIITNLEQYLPDGVLDEYVNSYIIEGRLGTDNAFKIFPTAKATEVLMLNKTDWDQFAQATGARTEDLATWEGLAETAAAYYHWTDSLTETENDGRAFFGRDALANYLLVGSKQLGAEIFHVVDDDVVIQLDEAVLKRMWDNYYIPYISGHYTSYGKFSSDDAKIGKVIALVGSTSGALYFPEEVTIDDNDSYPIESLVLPLPNFKHTDKNAVQQGAGIVVLESDEVHEKAAVTFLQWFTEKEQNTVFSTQTGYLPVKKAAYQTKEIEKQFTEIDGQPLPKQLQQTIPVAMKQIKTSELYYSPAFKEGFKARRVLETALSEQAETDRDKVIELISQGLSHEEAVATLTTEDNFNAWLQAFEAELLQVIRHEE